MSGAAALPRPAAGGVRIDARLALGAILLLGLALRLGALRGAGIEHPDEIFQYLEQAYRWLTGTGVVPWEARDGLRGGLMPLALAGPMTLGRMAVPTAAAWAAPRVMLVTLSLAPIAAAWTIGRRRSETHAAFAALAIALAPDLVHFAPHALAEPVAVAFLLSGSALGGARARPAIALGGLLLALGACVRFHYAPAALMLSLATPRAGRTPLLAGALIGLGLSALADRAIGVTPFGWIAANIGANLVEGRSALYGTAPPGAYVAALAQLWGIWGIALIALGVVGARGRPALAAAAIATLALHMLVAHKEYRFILLASALLTLLAGLGTADLLAKGRRDGALWAAAAASAWLIAGLSVSASGRAAALAPPPTPGVTFFTASRADPRACGVGLWRVHWSGTTGIIGLGRALPILIVDDARAPASAAAAFNRLIAPRRTTVSGFVPRTCDAAGACLFVRTGNCTPSPGAIPINRWLREHNQ